MWTDIIYALPRVDAPIQEILPWINLHRARDNDKENLWTDPERFPELDASRLAIMATESDLAEELKKSLWNVYSLFSHSDSHSSQKTFQDAFSELRICRL